MTIEPWKDLHNETEAETDELLEALKSAHNFLLRVKCDAKYEDEIIEVGQKLEDALVKAANG